MAIEGMMKLNQVANLVILTLRVTFHHFQRTGTDFFRCAFWEYSRQRQFPKMKQRNQIGIAANPAFCYLLIHLNNSDAESNR